MSNDRCPTTDKMNTRPTRPKLPNPWATASGNSPLRKVVMVPAFIAIALLASMGPAMAQTLVTYHVEGVLTNVRDGLTVFEEGKTFDIYFTVDLDTPDTIFMPNWGVYDSSIVSFIFDYENGSYLATANSGKIEIANGIDSTSSDIFTLFLGSTSTLNFPLVDGRQVDRFGMTFIATPPTPFVDDALAQNFADPAFTTRFAYLEDSTNAFIFDAQITSVAVIPEPTGSLLILTATAFLFCSRRRSLRKSKA